MNLPIAHQSKNKGVSIVILLLFALIFLSTFNNTSQSLKTIGFIAVFITLTISFYALIFRITIKREIHKIHLYFITAAFLFFAVMVIGLVNNLSPKGAIVIFQFTTVFSFFIIATLIKWDASKVQLAKILVIFMIMLLPVIADVGLIGAYMAFTLFFVLLERKKTPINLILIGLSLFGVYSAGMRGVYLLLVTTLLVYIFWKLISKNKILFITFFTLVITGLLGILFIYPKLQNWSKFNELDLIVRTYTNKRLLSGRNDLWDSLIIFVNQKPYFGYGTGVLPSDLIPTTLSSHNLFLQTALQNGYIGMSLLMIIFFLIWLSYYKSKHIYSTRLSASFFIGILIYQSFEVVLTQTKMDTAFMLWLIISVGVSNSIYLTKKETIPK